MLNNMSGARKGVGDASHGDESKGDGSNGDAIEAVYNVLPKVFSLPDRDSIGFDKDMTLGFLRFSGFLWISWDSRNFTVLLRGRDSVSHWTLWR